MTKLAKKPTPEKKGGRSPRVSKKGTHTSSDKESPETSERANWGALPRKKSGLNTPEERARIKVRNQRIIREAIRANKIQITPNGLASSHTPYTPEEHAEAQRGHALRWKTKSSKSGRDIGPLPMTADLAIPGYGGGVAVDRYGKPLSSPKKNPDYGKPDHPFAPKMLGVPEGINWDRRLACKLNLKLFAETYLSAAFYFGWSDDQLRCLAKTQQVFIDGGMFALAMPRAGGKTAICRAGVLWGTAFAHRRFPYFIGSIQPLASQTLKFIKTHWYQNKLLQQDFPEIGYPIWKLNNRWHLTKGQLYNDQPTHIEWGQEEIRYPCLVLPEHVVKEFQDKDPSSVRFIESQNVWVSITAGIPFACSGIDGSIRGEAETHPITLEQPRPDLVLLDDIQKEAKADSPIMCEKLVRLVDGAVSGLFPPGQQPAILMPCTVIRDGDVSDTFLNTLLKPDYQGERCRMVLSWPEGVTDYEINNDSEAGRFWNEYGEIRRIDLRATGKFVRATEFYADHRAVMDGLEWGTSDPSAGVVPLPILASDLPGGCPPGISPKELITPPPTPFVCSWLQRFDSKVELSANQHAMNLRLRLGTGFLSEYQNIGLKLHAEGEILITADQLAAKVIDSPQRNLPADAEKVVAMIDVQNEILFYTIFGTNMDFTGVFTDYGTWPEVNLPFFTKDNTESWSLITRSFFNEYPKFKDKAIKTAKGKIRAPLEAKIYYALSKLVPYLLSLEFTREGTHPKRLKIERLGIDTRWGQASDAIKRFIKESKLQALVPYYGQAMPPTNRQFEEYEARKGWQFEHQVNPQCRETKWCIRPNVGDGMYYMAADVSRLKDFLFQRLASPPGSRGSISMFQAPAERHEMFAHHVCNSEYPEPVTARGMVKNIWTVREGTAYDNDYLDCATGCMALASMLGVSLKTTDDPITVTRRSMSAMVRAKKSRVIPSHSGSSPVPQPSDNRGTRTPTHPVGHPDDPVRPKYVRPAISP